MEELKKDTVLYLTVFVNVLNIIKEIVARVKCLAHPFLMDKFAKMVD
jgi:hypothetical protein